MKKLYTIKELAKKYNKTEATIRGIVHFKKIKKAGIAKGTGSPSLYKLDDRFKVTRGSVVLKKCEECGQEFKAYHKVDRFCGKRCRQVGINRRNKKTDKKQIFYNSKRDFEFSDRAYQVKKGMEDMKRLKECTVDCLLEEFGDIE